MRYLCSMLAAASGIIMFVFVGFFIVIPAGVDMVVTQWNPFNNVVLFLMGILTVLIGVLISCSGVVFSIILSIYTAGIMPLKKSSKLKY